MGIDGFAFWVLDYGWVAYTLRRFAYRVSGRGFIDFPSSFRVFDGGFDGGFFFGFMLLFPSAVSAFSGLELSSLKARYICTFQKGAAETFFRI